MSVPVVQLSPSTIRLPTANASASCARASPALSGRVWVRTSAKSSQRGLHVGARAPVERLPLAEMPERRLVPGRPLERPDRRGVQLSRGRDAARERADVRLEVRRLPLRVGAGSSVATSLLHNRRDRTAARRTRKAETAPRARARLAPHPRSRRRCCRGAALLALRAPADRTGPMKVLVADDSMVVRRLVCARLAADGHDGDRGGGRSGGGRRGHPRAARRDRPRPPDAEDGRLRGLHPAAAGPGRCGRSGSSC